ncbi:MAG: Omp28-related outer membrane protein [Bacteroidales bacterium]|nr:Omp28-related outer membrane protein [Bacteroidales bacterium]
MKKIYTLLLFSICLSFGLTAQVLVSTDPIPKNAILEEYTGIHCTYCPDGHAIAQSILDANPGRAFTIAIHQGSFAVPSAGEPDYRTTFGDALAGQTGLTGYPSGTVNRHVFTGSTTALNRGSWSVSCDQVMQEISPVNIGISSEYEASIRQLTIQVELYYTSDAPASSNFINVALIQDSIYGPQTGGNAGNNYRHMHMLRHMITGQWGDEVTTTTAGSLVTRTYTYTVPAAYINIPAVVENMKVVAFVTEDHQEIYTGDEVDAIGGTNLYIGNITSEAAYIKSSEPGIESIFNLEANSNIEGTEPFEFSLEAENAPADWTASFFIDGIEYTGPAIIDLTKTTPKEVNVIVGAGTSPGFPGYVLKMKSVTNPVAPEKMFRVMVISGVTDLIVNGTGGPETVNHQDVYLDGLAASGITSYAVTNANVMRDMINASAYQEVFTCWLNIAWTFPALTDSQAEAVMDFMSAGHNIFIGGQDIGWDIMSGADGSNGTPITRDFYTNYLNALYVADGSSANNKLNANVSDPVFGAVAQSNIVDVYAGNMYPEEINAGTGADIIFNYTTTAKHAAIKYEAPNYRSIYFGIGLEMVSNAEVRNEIISLSREWLAAEMTGVDYQAAMNSLISGQNYPNPASEYTWIAVSEAAAGGTIEIYNLNGTRVITRPLGSETLNRIDLSNLPSGIYTYRIVKGNEVSGSKKLTVIR